MLAVGCLLARGVVVSLHAGTCLGDGLSIAWYCIAGLVIVGGAGTAASGVNLAANPQLTFHHTSRVKVRKGRVKETLRHVMCMQARAKELRLELLNSKRLKAFFEEHPGELSSFGQHTLIPTVSA